MCKEEYEIKIKELKDTINKITAEKEELELVVSTLKEHIDDLEEDIKALINQNNSWQIKYKWYNNTCKGNINSFTSIEIKKGGIWYEKWKIKSIKFI